MIRRLLTLPTNYSFFLFGPRGVGKSTLIQHVLRAEETYTFDLLNVDWEMRFNQRPADFGKIIDALPTAIKWIVVDEVQKVPSLLNEVHRQIEKNPTRYFALTGSSARKLKRGQANLLAGRAFAYSLFPLTHRELGAQFDLEDALAFGTLPKTTTFTRDQKKDFLRTYSHTYLKEEIQQEGLIRNLPAFQRFLSLAAANNGAILSWTNFAQEVGVDSKTVRSYYSILEETLVGFLLPAYHRSLRKRQRTHPKFYFFDTGVQRALAQELNLPLREGHTEYGRAFEHFWIIELHRLNAYFKTDFTFSYLATDQFEVDLVIERPGQTLLFVEIKSSDRMKPSTLNPLSRFIADVPKSQALVLCREPAKRREGKITICPWQMCVKEIFGKSA